MHVYAISRQGPGIVAATIRAEGQCFEGTITYPEDSPLSPAEIVAGTRRALEDAQDAGFLEYLQARAPGGPGLRSHGYLGTWVPVNCPAEGAVSGAAPFVAIAVMGLIGYLVLKT